MLQPIGVPGMRQSEEHRCFPQPPNRDATMWRYFDTRKFMHLMRNRVLWFSRADLLGDPCEGSRPRGDASIYAAAEQELRGRGDIKALLVAKAGWKRLDDEARQRMFISCWTMQAYDNMAMWERYCHPKEAGIAVQTTYARLDSAMPLTFPRDQHIMLGQVHYGDYESIDFKSDPSNVYSHFMLKKVNYADECEVRAVSDLGQKATVKGIPVAVDLNVLLERIVVSPYAPNGVALNVERVVRSGGHWFPVAPSLIHKVAKVY